MGNTLVKKCCHFFDLFCLIAGQEMDSRVSKMHQGLLWDHYDYQYHEDKEIVPILYSTYVLLDFVAMKGIAMTANSVEAEALPK